MEFFSLVQNFLLGEKEGKMKGVLESKGSFDLAKKRKKKKGEIVWLWGKNFLVLKR